MARLPAITVNDVSGESLTLPDGRPAVFLLIHYGWHLGQANTWTSTLDKLDSRYPDLRCWELPLLRGPGWWRRFHLRALFSGRLPIDGVRRARALRYDADPAPILAALVVDENKLTILLIDGQGHELWRGHGAHSVSAEASLEAAILSVVASAGRVPSTGPFRVPDK